jgi:hypothetical protein
MSSKILLRNTRELYRSIMTSSNLPSSCANELNTILLERYLDVLDIHELVRIAREEKGGKLSGLFLPEVDAAYLQSKVRVMLIGQETRGWGKELRTLAASDQTPQALRAYVQAQMTVYRKFSPTAPGTSKFRQFHSKLHATLGKSVAADRTAVFWGNLLCVSLNGKSPRKASEIESIAAISRRLLSIQLEILRPDLIVFGTGYGYDQFLKQQLGDYTTLPGLKPKHYWPFEVHNPRFKAWRVRHPRRLTHDIKHELLSAVRACATLHAPSEHAMMKD